jgi:hypothetical protein
MAEPVHQGVDVSAETVGPFAFSWQRRHLTVDERVVDSGRLTAQTGV